MVQEHRRQLKVLLLVVRHQRRRVVRVVKKEPGQVNGTVERVGGQAITLVRARKMQKKILLQIQVSRTKNL